MMASLCLTVLLSAATVLGYVDQPDPSSNLRPDNITGLIYYLYRWTGSLVIAISDIPMADRSELMSLGITMEQRRYG
jgi:hypothetical protein